MTFCSNFYHRKRGYPMHPLNEQIENNFAYHPADELKGRLHGILREALKETAYAIDSMCPNSREKSLAMTKLEEAMMWANAAIARNELI